MFEDWKLNKKLGYVARVAWTVYAEFVILNLFLLF